MFKITLISLFFFTKSILGIETFNSDVIVVVKDQNVIFKHFKEHFNFSTPHPTYSLSKMYLNLFVGFLNTNKLIDVNKSIFKYPVNEFEKKLTIERLIRMESGYRCVNDFEGFEKIRPGIIAPLSNTNSITSELLQKCLPIYSPGANYHYSFFDINLLITHLIETLGRKNFHNLFQSFLKNELQLKATHFKLNLPKSEKLPLNFAIPPTIIWMESSTEDIINTIQKTIFNKGSSFLRKNWIKDTFEFNAKLFIKKSDEKNFYKQFVYGRFWFLNRPFKDGKKAYEKLPTDLVFIHGLKGQIIAIFPKEKTIFLRLADEQMNNLADRETVLNYFYFNYIKQ